MIRSTTQLEIRLAIHHRESERYDTAFILSKIESIFCISRTCYLSLPATHTFYGQHLHSTFPINRTNKNKDLCQNLRKRFYCF